MRARIAALKATGARVLAIDVPTGIDASTGILGDVAVSAVRDRHTRCGQGGPLALSGARLRRRSLVWADRHAAREHRGGKPRVRDARSAANFLRSFRAAPPSPTSAHRAAPLVIAGIGAVPRRSDHGVARCRARWCGLCHGGGARRSRPGTADALGRTSRRHVGRTRRCCCDRDDFAPRTFERRDCDRPGPWALRRGRRHRANDRDEHGPADRRRREHAVPLEQTPRHLTRQSGGADPAFPTNSRGSPEAAPSKKPTGANACAASSPNMG